MRHYGANKLARPYDFGVVAESQVCWKPRGSLDIRRLEPPPCAVTNREHPDRLSALIDFIYDTVHVRFLAVEQVPQFSSKLSSFWGHRAAIGAGRKRVDRLLHAVVPARGRFGFGSVLFHIKGFEIAGRAIGKLNVTCHVCDGCRQRPLWGGGGVPGPRPRAPGGSLLPNPRGRRCRAGAGTPRHPARWPQPFPLQ